MQKYLIAFVSFVVLTGGIGSYFLFRSKNPDRISETINPEEILGMKWQANSMKDFKTIENSEVWLEFVKESFSGKAGCNSLFGSYKLESNGNIKIPLINSTKMYCGEDIMAQEHKFSEYLTKTKKVILKENNLKLLDENNEVLIELESK